MWAIREVWRTEHDYDHGLRTFAAEKVTKVGSNEHPTPRAVGKFYERIDADADWRLSKISLLRKPGRERIPFS